MKIKKKLAVTLTLLLTLSIISTNNYALENNKGNETKKEQKEEYIKANTNIKNIIIVGGEKSISSSVEDELKALR